MTEKILRVLGGATIALFLAMPAYSQRFEINPYAGGFFSGSFGHDGDGGDLKSEGLYGARGTYFMHPVGVEGSFSYIDQFQFKDTGVRMKSLQWDVNGVYEIPGRSDRTLRPFVTFGIGGMTLQTDQGNQVRLAQGFGATRQLAPGELPDEGERLLLVDDGDTFFSINYGGGVETTELWGPIGLRFDVRGRTLPHIFNGHGNWLETVGGVTIRLGSAD